jgi:hypothetical protein
MDRELTVRHLKRLRQLDAGAEQACRAALSHAIGVELQERLLELRNDHRRHIAELDAVLEELNADRPSARMRDRLLAELAGAGARLGAAATLVAMLGSEERTRRAYANEAHAPWASPLAHLLERH